MSRSLFSGDVGKLLAIGQNPARVDNRSKPKADADEGIDRPARGKVAGADGAIAFAKPANDVERFQGEAGRIHLGMAGSSGGYGTMLVELLADGLVQQRANHRAIIAEFTAAGTYNLYQMRKMLEGEAARLAAKGMDRATLAQLRATADMLARDRDRPNWLDPWAGYDEELHNAIAQAGGSPRLWQGIARYHLLHRGFNKLGTTPEALKQALGEHVRILDALGKRDPKEAQRAMVNHLQVPT